MPDRPGVGADRRGARDAPCVRPATVRIGAEIVRDDPGMLRGCRVALVTNPTGMLPGFQSTLAALCGAGVEVVAVLAPEHGLHGSAQAGRSEPSGTDPDTGVSVHDIYQVSGAGLDATVAGTGADTVLFDMQDVGVRFWTFTSTMFDTMVSAARLGLGYLVLDRPNPLGGMATAGAGLDPGCASFVGRADIPQRHGLTCGELALEFDRGAIPRAAGRPCRPGVVRMVGWHRGLRLADTDVPWIMPSPNLPTPDSLLAYAGTGLLEGTNLSEGRGTTRPFELVGAPWVDGRFVAALRERRLPGVRFREVWFSPTFSKHAGEVVRGVQLHVDDPIGFEPVGCALTVLEVAARCYPDEFRVITPERDPDGGIGTPALDRLWGSAGLRHALAGPIPDTSGLARSGPPAPNRYPADVLLYGNGPSPA